MMATKVYIVKTIIFPVVTNSSENWNTRKAEEKSMPLNVVQEKIATNTLDWKNKQFIDR